jgi:hypothetical protein
LEGKKEDPRASPRLFKEVEIIQTKGTREITAPRIKMT